MDYIFISLIPFWDLTFGLISDLAWPIVVVLLLLRFQGEISKLFSRVSSLAVAGTVVALSDPADAIRAQESAPSDAAGELRDLKEFPGVERTPAAKSVELDLHKVVDSVKEEDRIDRLVQTLARTQLDLVFSLLHHYIFGSQIELLRKIRESNGFSEEQMKSFHVKLLEGHEAHGGHSLDEYLQFLIDRKLIEKTGPRFNLTAIGNDYLLFLYRSNLPTNRLM